MDENVWFGFVKPEESKFTDLWLLMLLSLLFSEPKSSSPCVKIDVSVENIHIADAKIYTEK